MVVIQEKLGTIYKLQINYSFFILQKMIIKLDTLKLNWSEQLVQIILMIKRELLH